MVHLHVTWSADGRHPLFPGKPSATARSANSPRWGATT
jgi:hypothetical protein